MVAGRGVVVVVVVAVVVVVVVEVVVVVVGVVVVVVFAVVVFAVVVFVVVTRCGRSYASKQREEVGGTYWGGVGGTEGFLASLYICEAAAAGAELVTDFSARLQLGQRED